MIKLTGGNVQSLAGLVVPNGKVTLTLSGDASIIASPFGLVMASIPKTFTFDASANLFGTCQIWSNQELTPATQYLVTFYDADGARINQAPLYWQFTQTIGQTVDIGTIVPFANPLATIPVPGPAGPQGLSGAPGPPGSDGADGADGLQGPAGATGPQGLPGLTGAQGNPGNDGQQGPAGAQGPIPGYTFIGSDGDDGPPGPPSVLNVANDVNITGSIAGQVLQLGFTGTLSKARQNAATVYNDQNNTFGVGFTQTFDIVQLKNFAGSAWLDVSGFAGADEGAKFAACAAALPSTGGVCDGTKINSGAFTTDAFNTTKPAIFLIGAGTHTVSTQLNYTSPTSITIASPAAPTTNTTTTTGGTLSGSVFVDVTYVVGSTRVNGAIGETAGSAELTVAMNAACPGTPTCTATINIPAGTGIAGATGVNVYQSNTTGTASKKLCNTSGPLDLGGTYQITANCAGAAMPTTTSAYVGGSAIIGAGRDSTILYFAAGGFITCGACNPPPFNWTFQDFTITQITGGSGQAKIVAFGGDNLTIKNVGFSGGEESIFWDGVKNSRILNTYHTDLHDGNGYIDITNVTYPCSNILIDSPVIKGGVTQTLAGYTAMIGINNCDFVDINHPMVDGVDCSRSSSCGAVGFVGVHHFTLTGGTIQNMINGDGVDVIGNSQTGGASRWSEDGVISGLSVYNNTASGGIGTNHGSADGFGIQESKNIIVTGFTGRSLGLSATAGQRLPCGEVYLSDSVLIIGSICADSAGGVTTNSTTNLEITSFKATNNSRSGLYANRSVSTCTVSAASPNVAWASGQAFGPWPQGTPITIAGAANPKISSVTDFHNLVLTANAGVTGTVACGVDTNGKITTSEFDNNGQTGEAGNLNKAGVYLDNGVFFQISNVSMDDTQTVKTQLNGLETAVGSTARALVNGITGTGGSGVLFLDNVGTSTLVKDDGTTSFWQTSGMNKLGSGSLAAATGAINTTETLIAKSSVSIPANRLVVGSVIRIPIAGTCTASVANTSTFRVRIGTAGTVADGVIATFVTGASALLGTNIPFHGEILLTVRSIGAAATITGDMVLLNSGVTGISTVSTQVISPTAASFNSTTANLIIDLTYQSAATTTTSTFNQTVIELAFN